VDFGVKAVQVTKPKELHIIEKNKPDLDSENDVLVKVKMVGICGSDITFITVRTP
jgi:L-gulonate 5-dehydrogenase